MERSDKRQTIERRIASIAQKMGIGYLRETWARANFRFDNCRWVGEKPDEEYVPDQLPCLLNVQDITGSFVFEKFGAVREQPNLLLAFCDTMPFDFTWEQAEEISDRLKDLAVRFVRQMGESGFFEVLPDSVSYAVTFGRFDSCLCVCYLSMTVKDLTGECY